MSRLSSLIVGQIIAIITNLCERMLRLELHEETIYFLENPEDGITKLATGTQIKYGNTIKDVFGLADINDLLMMLKHNKKFQECICKAHEINEQDITLDLIFRVASKSDLSHVKDQEVDKEKEGQVPL
jgi:hypothetical protein